MSNLFRELKRRSVYKVTAFYVVISWLFLQVADTLFPAFDIPNSAIRILAVSLFFGFPIVIGLAWVFDITPQGIQKTEALGPDEAITLRKRDYFISALVLLLFGVVIAQQVFRPIGMEPIANEEGVIVNAGEIAGSAAAAETPLDDKSIAVLVLANLSPDPDNAYFAAGVHEEILNQLTKISALKVTSRTTVLRYLNSELSAGDIGRELNVGTILEGSVRFAGNRVAITTQLIRVHDDVHLWGETYERELDDIFYIQSDVAKEVANALQATLSLSELASIERPPTVSTTAYTLFLQHRYQYEQEGARQTLDEDGWVEAGIRRMEQAIVLDPMFTWGFAELGFLKFFKGRAGPYLEAAELFDQAIMYANRAIELDSSTERAYAVLQQVYYQRRDWDNWRSNALQSVGLPDTDGRAALNFSITLSLIGENQEAFRWMDVAIGREPSLALYWQYAVMIRINGHDYESALVMAERYRAVGGDDNAYHTIRAYALDRLGRSAESRSAFNEISPGTMVATVVILAFHDYLRCQAGEQDEVREELGRLTSDTDRELRIRYCAYGIGDLDAIFDSFRLTMSWGRVIWYTDIISDEVRKHPGWQEVAEYMDFPTMN